jgi:hypothetical protein
MYAFKVISWVASLTEKFLELRKERVLFAEIGIGIRHKARPANHPQQFHAVPNKGRPLASFLFWNEV